MERRDLVLVGASAGGLEPLRVLIGGLPDDFPATVLIVLHVPESAPSALPAILARATKLRVRQASEADPLVPGHVLTAPPGVHLVVYDHHVTLSRGPRENGHRPAVDVLFRSAARTHGPRAIGVVLSGALDDGTAGMLAVRARGGIGIAQDPAEALHPSMPMSAIAEASPDYVLPVHRIAQQLTELVADARAGNQAVDLAPLNTSYLLEVDPTMPVTDVAADDTPDYPNQSDGFSCPDCGGTLFKLDDDMLRYRCRVGHGWSAESLIAQQSSALETALWTALRTLEEKAALTGGMSERAHAKDHVLSAQAFDRQRVEALAASQLVRELLGRMASGDVDLVPHVPLPGGGG